MLDFFLFIKLLLIKKIALICSGLIFIILACAEASFRYAGMTTKYI